jgi:hypothetical protein
VVEVQSLTEKRLKEAKEIKRVIVEVVEQGDRQLTL